jgi:thioredoxin-dependent peroxiredoxin
MLGPIIAARSTPMSKFASMLSRVGFAWRIGLLAAFAMLAGPVYAALKPGEPAPDFTTQATLAGKPFTFALADALKSGPVVLYFYPAAFTKGCTIEAHEFAEATEKFKALGATVIGVSHDGIDTLNKFSVSECRSKFAVASDADLKIAAVTLWKAEHPAGS